jgi:arylsulfatase A-like enzyme
MIRELVLLAGVFGVLNAVAERPANPAPAGKPNVVFILTDDQGYGDVERHGHPLLKTPHMNRLYDESVRFDNFYVSPSCSPTRAALMTGMHEFRNGVTHTRDPREHLYLGATLLPQLLKTAGYRTGHIGKWHLGWDPKYHPYDRGFDFSISGAQHFDPVITTDKSRRETREGYREDIYFDEAMSFIDDSGPSTGSGQADNPFFLFLCTYSPHTPLKAPEEYIAPFRGKVTDDQATYLGMIANIDYNLGRLLSFLEARELDEETIVIFMNDNGVTVGLDVYNAGMRGSKCTIWHGGSRAMSFWRWPGTWKPHRVDNLTAHLDVLPTLCELAGVDIPRDLQSELEGFSMVPLLQSERPVAWHDNRMLFQHVARWPSGMAPQHKYAMAGIRRGNYLLARSRPCDDPNCTTAVLGNQCATLRAVEMGRPSAHYTENDAAFHWGVGSKDRWGLFDTKTDPACRKDLAAAHPERVSSMIKSYDAWWDDVYPDLVARGGEVPLSSTSEHGTGHKAGMEAMKAPAPAPPVAAAAPVSARQSSMFKRMDANVDKQVTKAEYVRLFAARFSHKDADGDGVLTSSEFSYAAAFKSADMDRDGKLTPEEFEAMYAKQFDARDADHNGVVTINEM